MLHSLIHLVRGLICIRRTSQDLCRLDCRCLEDIGLNPGDVPGRAGRGREIRPL